MIYEFENFELDTKLCELRRDGSPCRMEPQVFSILLYFVENRDRVVTKNDLFDHIWTNRVVTDSALTSRVKAVRAALGDGGREQRLIKTLHGRGFRFVGDVVERRGGRPHEEPSVRDRACAEPVTAPLRDLPGRGRQQSQLLGMLDSARDGSRQAVFIAGEAGLGKTTLVRSFVSALAEDESVYVAHGQCLEHHGSGEAYMPVLEALARLCSEESAPTFARILAHHAPTWAQQMPGLAGEDETGDPAGLRGGNQDRMLREMVEALEAFASRHTLVLVLEDIHWSDPSTIDLVVRLAMRSDKARLIIVATYRPADLRARKTLYSTVETLVVREYGREIELGYLDESAVDRFLDHRFESAGLPPEVGSVLFQRTGGHPLFARNVVEHWLSEGRLTEADDGWRIAGSIDELAGGVPDNLKLFIQQFIEELEETDRSVLEVAAVRGREFSTAEIAAVLGESEEAVEARCVELADRGRWIHAGGVEEWHDGSISSLFTFAHDLYQEVLYFLVPNARRARIHRTIGERLESAYGDRAGEKAVELSNHFVQGRVPGKAVRYLHLSAGTSLDRNAPREAITALRKALELTPRISDETSRSQTELNIQLMLATTLIALEGVGSESAEQSYERARRLSESLGDSLKVQAVLYGMGAMYEVRGDFNRSQSLMRERMKLLTVVGDHVMQVETHELLSCSLFHQGQYVQSLSHAREGLSRFNAERHSTIAPAYGENPGISCSFWAALTLLLTGEVKEATGLLQQGMDLSLRSDQHYSLATAYTQAAAFHQILRNVDETMKWAELAIESGARLGFALRSAMGAVFRGWAQVMQGKFDPGIKGLRQGIDEAHMTGACMDRAYFLGLLADACVEISRFEDGMQAADSALHDIKDRKSYFYAPELYRLRAVLLLEESGTENRAKALTDFEQGLGIAREQGAKLMELRVRTSLARSMAVQQGDPDAARDLIDGVETGFSSLRGTVDYGQAMDLLQSLR